MSDDCSFQKDIKPLRLIQGIHFVGKFEIRFSFNKLFAGLVACFEEQIDKQRSLKLLQITLDLTVLQIVRQGSAS